MPYYYVNLHMSQFININTSEIVEFTNKLEKMHRSDLPIAIRNTLNEMAFRMKGYSGKRGEIDKEAERQFDYRRNKTLFKAMTGVNKAKGFNIKTMSSEAGIINRSGRTDLAEGLAQQQKGGNVKSSTTPLKKARTGKNIGKRVRKKDQHKSHGAPYEVKKRRGKRFVELAYRSERTGRPLQVTVRGGESLIGRVRKIRRVRGKVDIKINWLYRKNKGSRVKLEKKRPFIDRAGMNTAKGMEKEFVRQAKIRITKTLNK